jgi:hypothetical protein
MGKYNFNKYIIITLVFVIIALSVIVIIQSKTEAIKNNDNFDRQNFIFSKNQECLKHKEYLEKKLQNKQSPLGQASLEQIFYSPKQNSCLYVEYTEKNLNLLQGEYFFNRRLFDILNDGPSSRPLDSCLNAKQSLDCEDFEKSLAEYKR